MASGYIQDDWKVTPKLTLNIGLRYDFATPPYSAKNELANFDPAGSGALVLAKPGSLGDRTLVQVNKKNFAPRFGFVYSLGNNTTIRGGYGLYYLMFKRNGSEDQLVLNPPFEIAATLNSHNGAPAFLLKNGFPSSLLDPNHIDLSLQHIHAMQSTSPTPYTQAWSLGFQRQLPGEIVFTGDYVGTKSTHLDIIHDLNQYLPGTTNFPYPGFGYLEYSQSAASSNYNGLELSAQRRFHRGLSIESTYTWSRTLQTSYTHTFVYTLSGSDIPQRFTASYVYELPFGKNKSLVTHGVGSALLGGWRTSGIFTHSSGLPFTVSVGGNYNSAIDVNGNGTSLPIMIGKPKVIGNVNCWFYYSGNKTCKALAPNQSDAYALPPLSSPYGNGSLNTLRGPHTNVFDFSLMRDFNIREAAKLQFRWEVFNLANSTLFAQPSSSLTSSSVGTITSLSGDPRIMQFALRLSF
jgi:hypothetical protein